MLSFMVIWYGCMVKDNSDSPLLPLHELLLLLAARDLLCTPLHRQDGNGLCYSYIALARTELAPMVH